MLNFAIAYAGTALVFFGLDFVWLTNMASASTAAGSASCCWPSPNWVSPGSSLSRYYVAGFGPFRRSAGHARRKLGDGK